MWFRSTYKREKGKQSMNRVFQALEQSIESRPRRLMQHAHARIYCLFGKLSSPAERTNAHLVSGWKQRGPGINV